MTGWKERFRQERVSSTRSQIGKAITDVKPFDRRFDDIGRVWWKRLRNDDLKELKKGKRAFGYGERSAPSKFIQVPRFPGQGYSKKELFSAEEWASVKRSVLRLWGVDDPRPPLNCCSVRMITAATTFIEGFV